MTNKLSALNSITCSVFETTLSKFIVNYGPSEFGKPSERKLMYRAFPNIVAEGVDVICG